MRITSHPAQKSKLNPKTPDPFPPARRNSFDKQSFGRDMHPVHLALVIGKKGSGVSTLLNAFRQRVDVEDTLIVDEDGTNGAAPPLAEAWDSDAIKAWLKDVQARHHAKPIVLASSDLRAPRHLLRALAENAELAATFRLDAVTCVTDARTTPTQVKAAPPCSADRIVLTHTDRARPATVTQLAKLLKALNPPAPILRAKNGDIGPARLVDSGLFDPITGSVDIDRWLCEPAFNFEATRRAGSGLNLPETALSRLHNDVGVSFFAVTIDQPINSTVLSVFLKLLMADRGTDLLRLKGIVATKDHPDHPALIDGREHLIQPLLWLPTWPTTDHRSRLVFSTSDFSETWIRTLLTTLSDQLDLAETPELQVAMAETMG